MSTTEAPKVISSCAMPFFFPPIPLASGQELGVDPCFGRFAPLGDALHALAELPTDDEPAEAWVLMPRGRGRTAPKRMVGKWLRTAYPSISHRSTNAFVGEVNCTQTSDTLSISGALLGRTRDVRLRVIHPERDLPGSFLDFHPGNIRQWYEDGLRTARSVADVDSRRNNSRVFSGNET